MPSSRKVDPCVFAGLIGLFFALASAPAAADQKNARLFAYGEHLAKQCAACHRQREPGAPRIAGAPDIWSMPFDIFAEKFTQAKSGSLNPSLTMSLQSLTEEDVAALLYFFEHR